jgi:hypothetical protein
MSELDFIIVLKILFAVHSKRSNVCPSEYLKPCKMIKCMPFLFKRVLQTPWTVGTTLEVTNVKIFEKTKLVKGHKHTSLYMR